jgi:hypothetical protein
MPPEKRLIIGDVLEANSALVRFELDDPVHE